MTKMFIRYVVRDYSTWREGFDAHESARTAVGMTHVEIYRSTEVPNEVVLMIDVADRHRVEEFAASEEVRLSNLRLGVIGTPERFYAE